MLSEIHFRKGLWEEYGLIKPMKLELQSQNLKLQKLTGHWTLLQESSSQHPWQVTTSFCLKHWWWHGTGISHRQLILELDALWLRGVTSQKWPVCLWTTHSTSLGLRVFVLKMKLFFCGKKQSQRRECHVEAQPPHPSRMTFGPEVTDASLSSEAAVTPSAGPTQLCCAGTQVLPVRTLELM